MNPYSEGSQAWYQEEARIAERRRVVEALREGYWLRHHSTCRVEFSGLHSECDCGLAAKLVELEKQNG